MRTGSSTIYPLQLFISQIYGIIIYWFLRSIKKRPEKHDLMTIASRRRMLYLMILIKIYHTHEDCENILSENVYSPEASTSATSTISLRRSTSSMSETPMANRMKKQKLDEQKRECMLQKITTQLDEKEDEFDITGKHIGNKLRNVSRDQMVFAERLIMNVLFEAQMGTLNRNTKLGVNKKITSQQDNNVFVSDYSYTGKNNEVEQELGTYLQLR